jgi:flagellar protein FliO/FliZ
VDTAVIVLRVALSLGVVLALMWVLHRVSRKKLVGGKAHGVTEHGVSLLTSGQAPAPELTIVTGPVVLPTRRDATPTTDPTATATPTPSADGFRRALEQQTGADPRLPSDLPMRPRNRRPQRAVVPTAAQLQGSILSADTWRQAAAALKNRRAG